MPTIRDVPDLEGVEYSKKVKRGKESLMAVCKGISEGSLRDRHTVARLKAAVRLLSKCSTI